MLALDSRKRLPGVFIFVCREDLRQRAGRKQLSVQGTAGDMISRLLGCAAGYCVTVTDTPSVLAVTIPLKVR